MGTEKLETDTRIVFWFMQRDKDKDELEIYIKENEQQFSNMDEDAYHMLSVMTNSKELIELMKRNKTKEGGANMCEALRQIKEECIIEGKKEGIQKGRIQGEKEGIQKGRIQGEKEGVAMSILSLLQMHGEVSEQEKAHIFAQKDLETLTQWVRKAALTKDVESFMKEIS